MSTHDRSSVALPAIAPAAPAPGAPSTRTPGTRTLGTLGMLGSPMMLGYGLALAAAGASNRNTPLMGAAGLLYLGGWACSLVGARRLGALGRSPAAMVALAVQVALLAVAAAFSVEELVYGAAERIPHPILDLAWPLSHTFMLVTGAVVLRARAWTGWRRWPALLVGFKIPFLAVVAASIGGKEPPLAAQMAAFTWGGAALFALGLAVRTAAGRAKG